MTYQEPISTAGACEAKPETRRCPNCGNTFAAGGRGLGKTFCEKKCREAFNARAKAEGAVLVALVKCHHQSRHAPAGSREAEVCASARRETAEIVRMFLEADEEAGRPPLTDYVEGLLKNTLYVDRTRKF
jgi:endogenous inhibitor of DNA gyrase (YacG/DUF329 family)